LLFIHLKPFSVPSLDVTHIERLLDHFTQKGFLSSDGTGENRYTTVLGFEEYEKITKGKTKSNQGFMALTFNSVADDFYKKHVKQAVQATGLVLKDMRELNRSGLINNFMEAEIKRSKFLIADITPNKQLAANPNVYWEAGLAEGANIPVFYLCQQLLNYSFPFDTRNHYRVIYDIDHPELALTELRAAICNTFPEETTLPS
jgi:hypothetical protein